MNIRVNRTEFLKALRVVEKAISENKIRPIISCLYLGSVGQDKLVLKGTDLELTIVSEIPCEVINGGEVVLSYQLIEEYLKEISDKEINLVVNENLLTIESTDSASEFVVLDSNEYPKLNKELISKTHKFPREKFIEILEKTKFAASTSSDNLAINCIRLEIANNKIAVAATDSYRLVYLEDDIVCEDEIKVSIPLNTVEALVKTFKSLDDEDVEFSFNENQITFIIGRTSVYSRVIGLGFPDYKGILNSTASYDKTLKVDVNEFIKVLKRVQIFVKNNSDSKYSAVFEVKEGKLLINGVSEIAKVNEEIVVEQEGEGMRISLNVKFILDFVQCLDREKGLIIELYSSSSAVNLKNEGIEGYSYIAMPLALRD